MKILIIGGTGTISSAIVRRLALSDNEVWVLNRGNKANELPKNVHLIVADVSDEAGLKAKLQGMQFDSVCEFIGFLPEQVERDYRIFRDCTRQYIFISSASAYNKPSRNLVITEGTTLANPHWEYSRNKIACEEFLMKKYREEGFPVTIVRPSHTYCEQSVPVGLHGLKGSYQVLRRMMEGKPILVHGDGSSLWTMTWNEDFAVGFTGLIGNPHTIGEAFQIMSDEVLTWNQIYGVIADILGVEYRPCYVPSSLLVRLAPKEYDVEGNLIGDKAVSVLFDCSKLRRVVPEFNPVVGFDEGARRAIDYMLSHKECQQLDPDFDQWSDKVVKAMDITL